MPSLFLKSRHRSIAKDDANLNGRKSGESNKRPIKTSRFERTSGLRESETVAHNSVFAFENPEAWKRRRGDEFEHRTSRELEQSLKWGYSSVGRAVALQAIGLGFESPCLHS